MISFDHYLATDHFLICLEAFIVELGGLLYFQYPFISL